MLNVQPRIMAFQDNQQDFQQCASKKRTLKTKRILIGNLPHDTPDLTTKLTDLFLSVSFTIPISAISVQDHGSSCQALIECDQQQAELLISKFHNIQFQGKRLQIHYERRTQQNKSQKNVFASSSWTKPRNEFRADKHASVIEANDTGADSSTDVGPSPFGQPQSMAALLADYGSQDTDWKNTRIQEMNVSLAAPSHEYSVLGQHGKAPIHIKVTSFGYRHVLRLIVDGVMHTHFVPLMYVTLNLFRTTWHGNMDYRPRLSML
jgi:hypothetical protein